MSRSRPPIEIDIAELRRALDRARSEAIGEADYLKLKTALDILDETPAVAQYGARASGVMRTAPRANQSHRRP